MSNKNPLLILLGVSAVFFVVFLAFVAIMVSNLGPRSGNKKIFGSGDSIGVLELKGVIADSKRFIEDLDKFVESSSVKGIIVRINSPGGSVAPSQEIYQAIRAANQAKPVYASMGSIAASGGYYAALGARKIYANPGSITGSIGVIMGFANLSRLYDWAKIAPYTIKTGKFKDVGSPNREMTLEERELLQGMLDNVLSQFRRAIAESRKMSMEKVVELSDGRIFSGEQAKAVKLIDEAAGIQEVVKALANEVGIKGKPRLIRPHRERKFLDFLLQESEDGEAEGNTNSPLANILLRLLGQITSHESQSLIGPQFMAPFAIPSSR